MGKFLTPMDYKAAPIIPNSNTTLVSEGGVERATLGEAHPGQVLIGSSIPGLAKAPRGLDREKIKEK